MHDDLILASEFNGLTAAQPSLPARWYTDPAHFDREMREIWRRNWIYLCRRETLPEPGAFRTFTVGGQEIVILADADGTLRGFFNTCRHRGSALCTEAAGRFDRRITCPYHQWSYALDGRLLATGPMRKVENFDRADYGLLGIAVAEWGGFVFANLAGESARPFDEVFGGELADITPWPMADLVVDHSYRKELACNWKIFWENFNECLHCPNIHPELSELVPIYSRGIMARRDDPEWQEYAGDHAPRRSGRLREGAESWSMDGTAQDALPGLSDEDKAAGQRYATLLPSAFIAAHVDYVRIVRLTPLGPERTELTADWLFRPETLARPGFDLTRITDFATLVMEQDGMACELNQRGLRADPFERGVLMQEEYEVFLFQDWIRAALGEARLSPPPPSRASQRRPGAAES
ncbi:aromatic ring-hydroxylating oxygenase subunit alpha [Ovoidimarina sediminis]|uniref:aromatic ring-hydroxylating oxygenase subunit alpha n=1 Tax=Ovoidimarina sediminis TaxID=3079856 RepID=UPI002912E8D1|nr:aromatic ring-hydroxylating dioxygenase subunit alpha [Rhodophyticola sp. MJ-SS7]MDU8945676.1 aromatic ring-hydroxylating dioxygenase subunit alpha [Rhodophyticola sp. MJ-SS7]